MKNTLNWFELPVVDMARATAFYEQLLGGTIRHEVVDGEPNGILPFEEPGVGGALVLRKGFAPGNGALIYLNANGDLEGAADRAMQAGGSIVLPPTPPYPFGRIAVIVDSEGNHVGLHSD